MKPLAKEDCKERLKGDLELGLERRTRDLIEGRGKERRSDQRNKRAALSLFLRSSVRYLFDYGQ